MEFETPFQRCIADCSVGGNEWMTIAYGIVGVAIIIFGCKMMMRIANAGRRHGASFMNLLLLVALAGGLLTFLVPTVATIEIFGIDVQKCQKECAHLAPNSRR